MNALSEFIAMGGYAVYVWTSYGAVAMVLLVNWLIPHLRERALMRTDADNGPETDPENGHGDAP